MAREVSKVNEDQDRLLDELLKGKTPEQILGESGLIKQMTKRMVERALQAELTARLGYDPHEKAESVRTSFIAFAANALIFATCFVITPTGPAMPSGINGK